MDYQLTDEETKEIQILNAKMVTIKNMVKEASADGDDALFSKLMDELSKTQISYDSWFDKMQTKFNIVTNQNQQWNVDFKNKILQLLG